ncbi:HotDog domain-containing protein [Phycomyces blakesleeanus]
MMDSYTEKILPFKYSPSFLEKTIAHNGEISIGYLLQISDEIAYVTGTKHLDVPSCLHRVSSHILTASVENFHLILPDTVQDIRISGHAVNIGTSSIEVLVNAEIISCADNTLGIRAKLKDLTGNCITAPTSNTVFIAKFNMVAVNIETGKPAKTNSLISTNSKERTAQELANFLKNTSYISNKDTTVSTNGRPETSKSASNLEADAFDKRSKPMYKEQFNDQYIPSLYTKENSMGGYKLVKDTTLQSAFIVTPQDRSVLGYLFGGKTLRYVYEIAYITARMFVGSNVRMFSLDEAKFHSKVNVGSTIKLTARVIYSSEDDNMFQVKVISNLSDCNGTFGSAEAMTANFTFLSLDKKIRNVVPRTLKENELYIEGRNRLDIAQHVRKNIYKLNNCVAML